jgi:hypothetical protein
MSALRASTDIGATPRKLCSISDYVLKRPAIFGTILQDAQKKLWPTSAGAKRLRPWRTHLGTSLPSEGKIMTEPAKQKFLVLYLIPASVMADWAKTDPTIRQPEEQKMQAAWGKIRL